MCCTIIAIFPTSAVDRSAIRVAPPSDSEAVFWVLYGDCGDQKRQGFIRVEEICISLSWFTYDVTFFQMDDMVIQRWFTENNEKQTCLRIL